MKKNEQLFEIIGDIKEEYVDDAINDITVIKPKRRFLPFVSAAAAALIIAVPLYMNSQYNSIPFNKEIPENEQVSEFTDSGETESETSDENSQTNGKYHKKNVFSLSKPLYNLNAGKDCLYLSGFIFNSADNITSSLYNIRTSEETTVNLDIPDIKKTYKTLYCHDRIYVHYMDQGENFHIAAVDAVSGNVLTVKRVEHYYSVLINDTEGNLISFFCDSHGNITRAVYDSETLDVKSSAVSEYAGYSIDMMEMDAFHNSDNSDFLLFKSTGILGKKNNIILLKIDADGTISHSEKIKMDTGEFFGYDSIFRRQNGNLCIVSSADFEETYITEIDSSSCKVISKNTADSFSGYEDFLHNSDGTDIIFKDYDGVWKYDETSGKKESLITFGSELSFDYCADLKVCYSDDIIFKYYEEYSEGTSSDYFLKMDYDGNIITDFSDEFSNPHVLCSTISNSGDILTLKNETSIFNDKISNKYSLVLYGSNNTVKSETDITDILNGLNSSTAYIDYSYTGDIILYIGLFDSDPNKNTLYQYILSESGEQKSRTKLSSNLLPMATASSDKGFYLFCADSIFKPVILDVDPSSGKTSKTKCNIPEETVIFSPVENYDFCYAEDKKIYGYYIAEKKSELLFETEGTINGIDTFGDTVVCIVNNEESKYGRDVCVYEK